MSRKFVRVDGIEGAPMRDESILYVPSAESYCLLNPSAAALWEALSEPKTEDDLATVLCEVFEGASEEQALADVRVALAEMGEMSIVQEV